MSSKVLLLLSLAVPLVACASQSDPVDDDGAPAEVDQAGMPDSPGTSSDEIVTNSCSANRLACLTYGQLQEQEIAQFTVESNASFGNGNRVRMCVRKQSPERGQVFCKSFKMGVGGTGTAMTFVKRVLFTFNNFPNAGEGKGLYNVSIADDADRTHPLVLKTFSYNPPAE